MTNLSVTPDPIAVGPLLPAPIMLGTDIVASPTKVAPLSTAEGDFLVQVTSDGQNIRPLNAAAWSENTESGLDVSDANGNLVASFAQGHWTVVQLVIDPSVATEPLSA